jgi:hypothetical protein
MVHFLHYKTASVFTIVFLKYIRWDLNSGLYNFNPKQKVFMRLGSFFIEWLQDSTPS